MRKEVMKKAAVTTLAFMLAVPAVTAAPKAEAAKKAPKMGIKNLTMLSDSTNSDLYIDANGAKIKKTTWSTSNEDVVSITKKKKAGVTLKSAKVGGESVKITAKVKYKAGKKKVKTAKLTATVKVEWLKIEAIDGYMDADDGTTGITVFFGEMIPTNSVPFDTKFEEGDTYEGFWDWDKSAQKVVEITDPASGSAVQFERASYSTQRGGRLSIRLGKELKEKTTYKVAVKGFQGMDKSLEGEVTIEPKKMSIKQVGYFYPAHEKDQKDYTAITLSTDIPFFTDVEYKEVSNPAIIVKDEKGKVMTVMAAVVATDKVEGDQLIIDVEGGKDSKKFTVEFTSIFLPMFTNGGVYYLADSSVVVDNYTDPNKA
ncbi:MAG: hypothetical protein IKQ97_03450 [Eubacterium sp.]|nr:hypothetical protein [Eubacterium sp.]